MKDDGVIQAVVNHHRIRRGFALLLLATALIMVGATVFMFGGSIKSLVGGLVLILLGMIALLRGKEMIPKQNSS